MSSYPLWYVFLLLYSPNPHFVFQHRRTHSPSLPALWVPSTIAPHSESAVGPTHTLQSPPSVRLSIGSLDLASPPRKSALPLTPPLTPASTRPADSDTSDTRSSRSNSFDIPYFDTYAFSYSQLSKWGPSETAFHMHKTPVPDADLFRNPAILDSILPSSTLPSPTSPTHPKHSPAQRLTELDSDVDSQPASRFLFVSTVHFIDASEFHSSTPHTGQWNSKHRQLTRPQASLCGTCQPGSSYPSHMSLGLR